MATKRATPLAVLTGQKLRALREQKGWRQDDMADVARTFGLDWTRATVAGLEIGRRALTLAELVILSMVFGVPATWFFEGKGSVGLVPDVTIPLAEVRDYLAGTAEPSSYDAMGRRMEQAQRAADDIERHLRYESYKILWPKAKKIDEAAVALAAMHDAEQVVARRFGVAPVSVALAAVARWGHGLSAERDRLVAERAPTDAPARSLQAMRGHITRGLVAEIEPQLVAFAEAEEAARQAAIDGHDRIAAAMEPDRGPGLTIPEGAEVIAHWKNQPTTTKKGN